jgi:cytochrome c peroxidase
MTRPSILARAQAVLCSSRNMRGFRVAAIVMAVLATVAVAKAAILLFAVFPDRTGAVQTESSDPATLNQTNPFFDTSIGTNGQACVTCHEPFTGITITPPFIRDRFEDTHGTDPLFRPNDTANNPSTTTHTRDDYSLIRKFGIVRIGEKISPNGPADYTVTADAATNATFAAPDMFPLHTDPQHPGIPTLSVFRRPLLNTNLNFDSAVLWDGRANISNIGPTSLADTSSQVDGAVTTLLLGPGLKGASATILAQEQALASFMTGVYTDQVFDNRAGGLDRRGATGGVDNLIALAQSPSRPCVFDVDTPTPDLTPFVLAVATASSCTPVVGGGPNFTLFSAWANLTPCGRDDDNDGDDDGRYDGRDDHRHDRHHDHECRNDARLSIARGENIFNTTTDGIGGHCTSCHSTNNLGNNPSATFMIREGHDSVAKLQAIQALAAGSGDANAAEEAERIQDMIDVVSQLPNYCLRPNTDPTPFTTSPCGNDPTDALTTDPGRALFTGHIADLGKQKPPTLRNLSVRAPFFHNGDAVDMRHLVTFYKFFLGGDFLKMTPQDEQDLINFLNAL